VKFSVDIGAKICASQPIWRRLSITGGLDGTGRMIILRVDKGFEHGPGGVLRRIPGLQSFGVKVVLGKTF
jgi:hypothetical protein